MSDEALMTWFGIQALTRPVCWATLTPEETLAELVLLQRWVTWLRERYHLDHRILPDCWAEHGDLVEELSALRTAWLYSFNGGARADAALAWHTGLHTARNRLRETVADTGCRPGQHRGPSRGG